VTTGRETVLVTGSSGFLGYPVAKRLGNSFNVVGFDRRAPPHPPPVAECLYVDVTSEASLRRGLDAVRELHGERLASVIHFAAYYDFSGATSPQYEQVTVKGTQRLLRMLRERFALEQFVFSSTMLVHAPTAVGHPITEDSPLDANWAYPQSKVRTEEAILAERGDVPAVIVRIAGVYDDLGHSVPLPRQIQRIYERTLEAHLYPGDLDHGQAMVHLDDIVDLCALLVARRHDLPRDLTLLAGEPVTLGYGELQSRLGQLIHGEVWRTRQIPPAVAKAGSWLQEHLPLNGKPFIKPWMVDVADDHYELDVSRARNLVGWVPKCSLAATLPRIVDALLADPWAWYRQNELEMPLWLQQTEPIPATKPAPALDPVQLERLRDVLRPHGHARTEAHHHR
jgi:nucleoside-diphosphate-sugar epimerase